MMQDIFEAGLDSWNWIVRSRMISPELDPELGPEPFYCFFRSRYTLKIGMEPAELESELASKAPGFSSF